MKYENTPKYSPPTVSNAIALIDRRLSPEDNRRRIYCLEFNLKDMSLLKESDSINDMTHETNTELMYTEIIG